MRCSHESETQQDYISSEYFDYHINVDYDDVGDRLYNIYSQLNK